MPNTLLYLFIGIGIAILLKLSARRISLNNLINELNTSAKSPCIETKPDQPIDFGYKSTWIALRASTPKEAVQALGLKNIRPANWETGLKATRSNWVFVTPSIDGWVLITGGGLPSGDDKKSIQKLMETIRYCSRELKYCQFFSTYRVVDFHVWIIGEGGSIQRAFAYLGENDETLIDEGTEYRIEHRYKEKGQFPNEDLVLDLARELSIDPQSISKTSISDEIGMIGQFPAS